MDVVRPLGIETVEGEISLVIDYSPGKTVAIDLLQGAMGLIAALDKMDRALLSSVDTTLEPVSIINDVQHSSLKLILARALKRVPDEHLKSLDWKAWLGGLLVQGKYQLLKAIESGDTDAPSVKRVLDGLAAEYGAAPGKLIGYQSPSTSDVIDAITSMESARALLPNEKILIQTDLGDVQLPETRTPAIIDVDIETFKTVKNSGQEFFKIKSLDLLGNSQWTVLRNNKTVRVDMLHMEWLDRYHHREITILPGDSLFCEYEEAVVYDQNQNEVERRLAVIEVKEVIHPKAPPKQADLL